MADEKKVKQAKQDKNVKPSWFVRVGRWFKKLFVGIINAFKNMWHELKKVSWPTKKDLTSNIIIVIGFMVFMGVVIGLLDLGATSLIKLLIA